MLTEQELNKIFSWLPYRDSWSVDRNQVDDNIESVYGNLISRLTKNPVFDTYYSENGSLGNYLEFFCYPKEQPVYKGNAILVCVSLCAPIAAYGQSTLSKGVDFVGWGELFEADKTGDIIDASLSAIEKEIRSILLQHNLSLLDKEFASRRLPQGIIEVLQYENHNAGNQYLHGIFQVND